MCCFPPYGKCHQFETACAACNCHKTCDVRHQESFSNAFVESLRVIHPLQIVAYNKMDIPDSSDYWQDIQNSLEAAGVPLDQMCAMSAATGQGVIDLVKLVHTALDELPTEVALCALTCA